MFCAPVFIQTKVCEVCLLGASCFVCLLPSGVLRSLGRMVGTRVAGLQK